jgi:antitoxin HigA-1
VSPTLPTPLIRLHPRMQFDPTVPLRYPAVVLRDDYMLPDGLTAINVAYRTGIPSRQMRRILAGAPINTEEALRFAALFDTSALYWLLLQTHYNLEYMRHQPMPGGIGVL